MIIAWNPRLKNMSGIEVHLCVHEKIICNCCFGLVMNTIWFGLVRVMYEYVPGYCAQYVRTEVFLIEASSDHDAISYEYISAAVPYCKPAHNKTLPGSSIYR